MEEVKLNNHNKQEYPPMHTAEHLLNGLMDKMYGCGRAFSAHIERQKSKLDFRLPQALTDEQVRNLETEVNRIIDEDVEVWTEFVQKTDVAQRFNLNRLPDDASETVRIVHVGNYDECLCIGLHVEHTAQIGRLRISSNNWKDGVQRLVFRLENPQAD